MSLPLTAAVYSLDQVHSQVGFAVRHLGISTVRGTFDDISGELTVGDDLAGTSVSFTATVSSVNTGSSFRDGHLLGAEFFDAETHPNMTFQSSSIEQRGDSSYALNGDLSIRGVSKPVTFDVTFNGSGVFPMDQTTHVGFSATGSINRSDFGVSYGVPLVSDEVGLSFEIQFVAPSA